MDKITEMNFELTEKAYESQCAINVHRVRILSQAFIKICDKFPELKEMFQDEIETLNDLDQKDKLIDEQINLFTSLND